VWLTHYWVINLFLKDGIKMLIRYKPKQDHIKCVPLIPSNEEAKSLKLTRTQVQLLPGPNEITDDEWKVMKPCLAAEIKSRVITVIEKDVTKSKRAPEGKAKNLAELPSADAVDLVAETVSPDTLKRWYQKETRDEVRLSIVERMKELRIEIPKYKGSDETNEADNETSKSPATGATTQSGNT
jgi:hypothetical protein